MKYRIVRVQIGKTHDHFQVQHRKWFMWFTEIRDHFDYTERLRFVSQEAAQEYIDNLSVTRTVVHEQEVISKFIPLKR